MRRAVPSQEHPWGPQGIGDQPGSLCVEPSHVGSIPGDHGGSGTAEDLGPSWLCVRGAIAPWDHPWGPQGIGDRAAFTHLLPPLPALLWGAWRQLSCGTPAASHMGRPRSKAPSPLLPVVTLVKVRAVPARSAAVPWHAGTALSRALVCRVESRRCRLPRELSGAWLLVRGIITCKSSSLMSLMKSSEGKHFSGELRIFISYTRNLTCRLVGAGNLSHEIVLLRAASSPAAFGNYLTHRLPLDRLPSVEMHLPATKSALFPLPTSLRSWCGSPAAAEGSSASSREPRSSLPRAGSPGNCNYISGTCWFCRCGAPRASPQQNSNGTTEPPSSAQGFWGLVAPRQDPPEPRGWFPARGVPVCSCAWGGLAGAASLRRVDLGLVGCLILLLWGVLGCAFPRDTGNTACCTHGTLPSLRGLLSTPDVWYLDFVPKLCKTWSQDPLKHTDLGANRVFTPTPCWTPALLQLHLLFASPGVKHNLPPGANCHSIM